VEFEEQDGKERVSSGRYLRRRQCTLTGNNRGPDVGLALIEIYVSFFFRLEYVSLHFPWPWLGCCLKPVIPGSIAALSSS
jgi:hypothetical protein